MREFQLLRMTIWSTIVTSAFWPYFSELISWMRLFQSPGGDGTVVRVEWYLVKG